MLCSSLMTTCISSMLCGIQLTINLKRLLDLLDGFFYCFDVLIFDLNLCC